MFTLIQNDLSNQCVTILYASNNDDLDYDNCVIELSRHFSEAKDTNASLSCVQVDKFKSEVYEYGPLFGKTKIYTYQIVSYAWNNDDE
jgi:hypothetical protein